MHAMWHWILYVLTWWSHDPVSLELERAKGAGCANVAYASFAQEPQPRRPKREADDKPPAPPCKSCGGSGKIYRPDGGYVRCPCGACESGACRTKTLP